MTAVLAVTAVLAGCLLIAGCGSAGRPPVPLAKRICSRAQAAAARELHRPIHVRILSADSADVRCRLAGAGTVLAVEAQTSRQAWIEYDTTQVHFAQVFGPSNIHNKSELPQNVTGVGPQAFWVPAQGELVATNAQEGSSGTYLTVTVTHRGHRRLRRHRGADLPVASAVARAALAAAPAAG